MNIDLMELYKIKLQLEIFKRDGNTVFGDNNTIKILDEKINKILKKQHKKH